MICVFQSRGPLNNENQSVEISPADLIFHNKKDDFKKI